MFNVILYQPEIPPNTGNIIRLCANTGCKLHLIKPLGFMLDDSRLKRAGLDYHEFAEVQTHVNLESCLSLFDKDRVFALSSKAKTVYSNIKFQTNDCFLFGPETRGLPSSVLDTFSNERLLTLPQLPNSRSLNLSNATSIVVYEAWRQVSFK